MIKTITCKGCLFEYAEALRLQDEAGLFIATTDDMPGSYPYESEHYCLLIVDEKGEIVCS